MHTSFITLPLSRGAALNSNCAPCRGLPTVLIVCACLRQYAPDGAVQLLGCAVDGAAKGTDVWHSKVNFNNE